jgi:3-oxoacyl-(acyl-carrier-protein) synthase
MAARFPVITGLGIITATGCGVAENWRAIAAGRSGLKPLTLFQSPRYGQIRETRRARARLAHG